MKQKGRGQRKKSQPQAPDKTKNLENYKEKIQAEPSLYGTVSTVYSKAKPVSRIIYIAEIVQPEYPVYQKKKINDGKEKEREKEFEKEKEAIKAKIIPNFITEIKEKLATYESVSNLMCLFAGVKISVVGIESSTRIIMDFMKFLKNDSKMSKRVHVITFNEECPVSNFPVFYKYEGEYSDKHSQAYRDMTNSEKGWALYDNFFCNLGRNLKTLINSEADFTLNAKAIKDEENKFVKFHPSSNEINVFMGGEYPSVEEFIELYLDEIDVNFDDDLVYPYYWPVNI